MSAFGDMIKQWFETNDMPNQQQFGEWVDKSRLKDEPIPMADVTGLIATLNQLAQPLQVFEKNTIASEDFYYLLNEGYRLEAVIIEPIDACTFSLEDTYTSEQLITDEDITAGGIADFTINVSTKEDRGFLLKNLPVKTKITIIKRKIRL